MTILSSFLDLLFPPKCVFCRKILDRGRDGYCAKCAGDLPLTDSAPRDRDGLIVISPLYYEGTVRDAVHRYKFGGASFYAGVFGKLLSDCVLPEYDIITWVPLSRERLRQRGYDQAMLLSRATASELGGEAIPTLRKTVDTKAQSELGGRRERQKNISGAYEVTDAELVKGRRVLLIDDVVTTGSTLRECVGVLTKAGAAKVVCAAFATTRAERKTSES